MENIVHEMMAPGIKAPDGIVYGMGCPGKGSPVGCIKIKKHPFKEMQIKRTDMYVIYDI
ncbi:MAG: hypothetical protein WA946_11040 [Nitrospirota bacterium]